MTPRLCVIGIPMDLGQSRRGVDMGPSAVRYAGLHERLHRLGYDQDDYGNIHTPDRDTVEAVGVLPAVVQVCEAIYEATRRARSEGRLPICLGGDHSLAVGTVGGATHEGPTGVLWIDAHGDCNTPETSPSGNLHGMPLAVLLGRGAPELVDLGRPGAKVEPRDVILLGVRSLDRRERALIRDLDLGVYTMREIDERGMADVAREALERLSHLSRIHVSLDMDSLDPSEAPGVGTPVSGGLTYREAHLLMEIIADNATVGSIDVVEINPILDHRNDTAKLALELLCSLLGQSIF